MSESVDLTLSTVSLLSIILCSTVGLVATVNFEVESYLDIINRVDDSYKHVLDDLSGMMDIALRFRDDPNYDYDPSDMDRIVMRDGVNGTREMVQLFNELVNRTLTDIEAFPNGVNGTSTKS